MKPFVLRSRSARKIHRTDRWAKGSTKCGLPIRHRSHPNWMEGWVAETLVEVETSRFYLCRDCSPLTKMRTRRPNGNH